MYPQAKPTLTDNPNSEKEEETKDDRKLWTMGISFFLLIIGLVYRNPLHAGSFHFFEYLLFFSAYLLVGWKVIWVAFQNIFHGQVFDEHFLMTLATLGAFVVHEMPEAVGVMLFYAAGEYLEDLAVGKSRRSIRHLLSIRSEVANLEKNGKIEPVSPEKVQVGENILVRPGERVPLDGVVLGGESSLDTSALTGESVPQEVKAGSQVLAGMINGHGLLKVQVSRLFQESSVAKILSLVQDAASRKSSTERFITRFSRYYTPIVVFGALAFATIPPLLNSNTHFSDWIYRALILLVISCPCALVISIPLGFFGGLGAASRAGILVKGASYLEALVNPHTVVFDKTGTLTEGTFRVTQIEPSNGHRNEEILSIAAQMELNSTHPIARSIIETLPRDIPVTEIEEYQEINGMGAKGSIHGQTILVGNERLMEMENIFFHHFSGPGTTIYVAINGKLAGSILVSDQIKPDAEQAIKGLRTLGVKEIIMFTGDNELVARNVAEKLKLNHFLAGMLPEKKVTELENLQSKTGKKGKVVFVGDGINDAPVIARADVGIAMGALGSDAAIEAADVVIMDDHPSTILRIIRIARKTRLIVLENIILALGVKGAFLLLGLFGVATMWEAVIADVGVTLAAILNSTRTSKIKKI